MNKNQLIIEDYDFFDTELCVYFSVNQELQLREDRFDIDEVDEWFDGQGLYEMSEDCWDYGSETHYTRDWEIDFDEFVSDYVSSDDIRDFIYDYYQNKPLPDYIEE